MAARYHPLVLRIAPVAAALVALALIAAVLRGTSSANDAFEEAAGVLGAFGIIVLACATRPAWPLSLGLALTSFSGHWGNMGIGLPLDRVLVVAGLLSTLVRARVRDKHALRTRPVDWLLALVALYAVVSAVLAGTLDDHIARFALIDRLSLLGFVLFFAAPIAFRERRDQEVLLGVLVALGAYLGLTALFETTGPDALVIPHYITDPTIGTHVDRARGPFTEAGENGLMLFATFVASVIAAVTWRSARARQLAVAVAALCALGVLLTVTRAAWLGAVAGTLIALMAARETRRYVVPAIAVSLLGVVVAFAAVPRLHERAQKRADDQRPLWDRQNSDSAALRMIAARPVLGFGWGRFRTDSFDFYRQSPDHPLSFVRNLHNVYLSVAVELGLLGTELWLLAIAVVLFGAIMRRGPPELRTWKLGLIAVATSYAVTAASSPLQYAGPTLLLWTWAGVAWGGYRGPTLSA